MTEDRIKLICRNRKAFFEYVVDDLFEAGLVLQGTEVKSLRQGKANINDAYARFTDGEIQVEIGENVRGMDTYIIQSTSPDANTNLMELLIMCDALKRASAGSITAVVPYYGYARQDRKSQSRAPITAKLVADLIDAAGASRVMSMDMHAGQIPGFFNLPFDHLYAAPVLLEHMRRRFDGISRGRLFGV